MWAAAYVKCDVVTELISLGADVDIQANVSHFYVSSCITYCKTLGTYCIYIPMCMHGDWPCLVL